MRYPFVWRKTAEDETAVWKAEASRQRRRAEQAEGSLRTEVSARRTIAELYADLCESHGLPVPVDAVNPDRRRAMQPAAGFDQAQARRAAERIAELQAEVTRARAEARADKKRADGLQKRLDDAVGLAPSGIRDSAPWQPGYASPKPDREATAS